MYTEAEIDANHKTYIQLVESDIAKATRLVETPGLPMSPATMIEQPKRDVSKVLSTFHASCSTGSVSLLRKFRKKPPETVQRLVSRKNVSESRGGCASKSKKS